jgi:hypothetical protein
MFLQNGQKFPIMNVHTETFGSEHEQKENNSSKSAAASVSSPSFSADMGFK